MRSTTRRAVLFLLLALTALPLPASGTGREAEAEIGRTLEKLYRAFCFDPGREPDWQAMESLFLPGAAFVDPVKPGKPPRAIGAEEFLANFKTWVKSPEMNKGFHERIVATRIDHFGHLAHVYVTFEGYVPGSAKAETRGLDSIQFVLDGEIWKLASFTTQYESPDLPLPARFAAPRP